MPKRHDLYAPSRARHQAKSALTRDRAAAAEQAAEQAAVGAALRESVDVAAARRGGAA